MKIRKEDALAYHEKGQPGKIEVTPTKELGSQYDLALAYSPGVAEPCKNIYENPADVYKYTAKGNLVAVISNGTAVLGLGNIGPEASKPVMEGKGVLFKKFAGIDVFDIEINENDPVEFVKIVKSLEPTFGGINLEDIKAPECFIIESELRKQMNIPVMHDDQHGTAIISAAALINALEIVNKKIENIRIVVNGAGAAAIACTKIYVSMGASPENILMCDSKGVINKKRKDLSETKKEFARDTDIETLHDALKEADFFLGLSVADSMSPDDLKVMAENPIVFALANPDPEIEYELAMDTRDDVIMATGRSDHPNQVNNVLGFPYIFRGALDVQAKEINEEMKLAAVMAIADLAKHPVPDIVSKAYGNNQIQFGKDYLIPKPLDPRLLTAISPAVAKAAIKSGVARIKIEDWEVYELQLQAKLGIDQKLMARLVNQAKKQKKKLVFTEANNIKILQAAEVIQAEGIAKPILLGNKDEINRLIEEFKLDLSKSVIMDVYEEEEKIREYAGAFYSKRKRKGVTFYEAKRLMNDRNYFAAMMVEKGEADALISGLTKVYPKIIRPALQIIGVEEGISRVAGMYIIRNKKNTYFFADTTVNLNPTAEELVDIIRLTNRAVRFFDIEPRIAVLSYSNFGSAKGDVPEKTAKAVALVRERYPNIIIDGDIQANVAVDTHLQSENYPFSLLANEGANTFVFPNLESGNIAYKLLSSIGGCDAMGPILLGMKKPVHILQMGCSVREIINMAALAVVDAQLNDPKV